MKSRTILITISLTSAVAGLLIGMPHGIIMMTVSGLAALAATAIKA